MHFVRGPDRLADLERDQFPDDEIAEGERENESRDRRRDRAKRHVTKDVEAFDLRRSGDGGNTSWRDLRG